VLLKLSASFSGRSITESLVRALAVVERGSCGDGLLSPDGGAIDAEQFVQAVLGAVRMALFQSSELRFEVKGSALARSGMSLRMSMSLPSAGMFSESEPSLEG
jgi:hypothetical protein